VDVVALVLRQGALLVLGGVTLGLGIAFAGGQALRSMLFGVTWFDPVGLISVIALLVFLSLVSMWLPARRAGRVDPVHVLRAE
jgi:macrolide transport system ATP-binding/permease protein